MHRLVTIPPTLLLLATPAQLFAKGETTKITIQSLEEFGGKATERMASPYRGRSERRFRFAHLRPSNYNVYAVPADPFPALETSSALVSMQNMGKITVQVGSEKNAG